MQELCSINLRIISIYVQLREKSEYLDELKDVLGLEFKIDRIEAYDISNISGFDSVGSMVVFNNGIPNKTQYRRFKIKMYKVLMIIKV